MSPNTSPDAERPTAAPYPHPGPPAGLGLKTPGLAAVLSFFPGLGNVYNGLYGRGITFFLIFVSLIVGAANAEGGEQPFIGLSIAFVWFFNVFDAYRQATFINYGYLPKVNAASQDNGSMLVPGVLLVTVGIYGILRRYDLIDLAWIIQLWPFAFAGLGAFLIWQSVRANKTADETSSVPAEPEA